MVMQNLPISPPVTDASQMLFASDGSILFVYLNEDADGLREVRRYERDGNQMVLRRSATYRRLAENDGATWQRVGEERIH